MKNRSDPATLGEAWDGMQVFLTGPVLAMGIVPGFLLCVPGLVLFGAALVLPLVLLAIVITLVGAVLAAPFLLVRAIRGQARRYRRRQPRSARPARAAGSSA